MTLVINYKKYEMFSDEEQLIYEDDDDDDDEWNNTHQDLSRSASTQGNSSSETFEKVSIRDTLDNDYFLDRTLTAIGTPENRIWDLGTPAG